MIIPMTDDERRLTEEYLYLVPEMVKKLTSRCAYVSYDEQQDLLQAGNLALCKAAMNYDNTRPFAVYARVAIRNAIYSYWRKLQKELIIPGLFEPPVRTLRATIPENGSHIFR